MIVYPSIDEVLVAHGLLIARFGGAYGIRDRGALEAALARPPSGYSDCYTVMEPMKLERLNRITVEEGKCGGRPCIRGFRIRVSDVLELLSDGASIEEILLDYHFLEREDVLATIEYAAHQADHPVLRTS